MNRHGLIRRLGPAAFLSIGLSILVAPTFGQERESAQPKQQFALPIEFDFDFGADNGNVFINRYLPLVSIPLNREWKVVNLTLAGLADAPGGIPGTPGNPEPIPGDRAFGLTDTTDAVFFTPTGSKKLIWGLGVAVGIPTATDDVLGSGKWSAGPAARITYLTGPWTLGGVITNRWSFAGDSDRAETNQLLVRGIVRCRLGDKWHFVYAPIITANWNTSSGERWVVPLGGGFGRRFETGSWPVVLSVQAYANVVKPDGAPDGVLRFGLILHVPSRASRLEKQ